MEKMKKKTENYSPEYVKGEVIVRFKDTNASSEDLARDIAKLLGYQYKGEMEEPFDGNYIFIVPAGKEEEAVKNIEKRDYVEFADRFDLKSRNRWGNLEKIIEKARELLDDTLDHLPDREYKSRVNEIISLLKKSKEKIKNTRPY